MSEYDMLAYWRDQRAVREAAYQQAVADLIGAGSNTYAKAMHKRDTALRSLQEADKRIRELEAQRRESND